MTSEQLAWLIRRHAIEMTHDSHGSHIGSVLSVADIIAVLYTDILSLDSNKAKSEDRDRFILSKGHAGVAVYAALAENGFFSINELKTFDSDGSRLFGHISHRVPGVELSTGSLGHGLSVGCGMAYAAKKSGMNDHRVFVVMSDGECDEGSVWESALFANHFRLNNLIAIIDYNKMQSMDFTENTLSLDNLADKWRAFGWHVIEICGHDHTQLKSAFEQADSLRSREPHRPVMIIADTIKGHGVSYMENDILWHYRFPHDGWEYDMAVTELHGCMPEGVTDPYTPDGIADPAQPGAGDDIYMDHTLSYTWKPEYPERTQRAKRPTGEVKK